MVTNTIRFQIERFFSRLWKNKEDFESVELEGEFNRDELK